MAEKHIHFIGICGVAMSALALAFKRQGWKVTGSDVGFYPPISTHLSENQVDYYPGWHPEKMGSPDLVVVGNVASSTNPEWLYVQEKNLPYKSYPEVVRDFFVRKHSIVCAGTYGKSTSTTLMTWILKQAGKNPSYMFGGLSLNDMPAAEMTDSDWSVLEGDEYKASRWDNGPKFAYYQPTHLLLTAVIWDHADVYPTEKDYLNTFSKLVASTPDTGLRIISQKALSVLRSIDKPYVTYGTEVSADYYYHDFTQTKDGISFSITHQGKTYSITSPCLGDYMADNIAGCFALAHQIGLDPATVIEAIKSFGGMKRRLEKRGTVNGAPVFDDIAHSPTKAKSVLGTLKSLFRGKVIAVFEPNTGNRQPDIAPQYDYAFLGADLVIIPRLTKVKVDPTKPIPFEGSELAAIISKTHPNTLFIDDDEKLVAHLKSLTTPDDAIIFMGSHGFRGMIEYLIA